MQNGQKLFASNGSRTNNIFLKFYTILLKTTSPFNDHSLSSWQYVNLLLFRIRVQEHPGVAERMVDWDSWALPTIEISDCLIFWHFATQHITFARGHCASLVWIYSNDFQYVN